MIARLVLKSIYALRRLCASSEFAPAINQELGNDGLVFLAKPRLAPLEQHQGFFSPSQHCKQSAQISGRLMVIRLELQSALKSFLGIVNIVGRELDDGPVVPSFAGFAFGDRFPQ